MGFEKTVTGIKFQTDSEVSNDMWEGKGLQSLHLLRGWSPDFLESLPVRKFLTMMLCWVSLSKYDSCSEL